MSSTMWLKLAFLAVVISMTAAQEVSMQEIKGTILQRIKSPNDTQEQLEAKTVIAEFLAQAVFENTTELEDDEGDFVPYRRDKDHHHERTRRPHRTRRPPSDYRDQTTPVPAAPVIVNQQPAALNPAAVVDDVQVKQQSVATQVPIITGSPGVSNPAAAPAATAAPPAAVVTVATPTTQPTTRRTRPTVDPNHVYQQVDKILGNVASGNIVGIVDESLAIRAPTPVRNFVTGILKVIFCNPFDRLLGRCTPNSSGAISSVQGG